MNIYNKPDIIGPPAKCHLMVFHLRAHDGPTLNASLVVLQFFRGSGPVLLEKPKFCDFSGGGGGGGSGPHVLPSGSAHAVPIEIET